MKRKYFLYVLISMAFIILCIWFSILDKQIKQNISDPVTVTETKVNESISMPIKKAFDTKKPQNKKSTIGQEYKDVILSFLPSHMHDSPEMKKILAVFESEEFETFIKNNPQGLGDFYDFFQSQGLPLDKNELFAEYDNDFKKLFPNHTTEQIGELLHLDLFARFLENDVYVHFYEDEAHGLETFENVLTDFTLESHNKIWMNAHFKGNHRDFGVWAMNVLQDLSIFEMDKDKIRPYL